MVKSRKGGQGAESPEEGPAMQTVSGGWGGGGWGERKWNPATLGKVISMKTGGKMGQGELTDCA